MQTFSTLLAPCVHESTSHRWILSKRASNEALWCFLFFVSMNQLLNKHSVAGALRRDNAHTTSPYWKHHQKYFHTYDHPSSTRTIWHKHDDVIKWKHFPRYWPFVRGIHRSPVNSPYKGQWRGALMFSLICARTNDWVSNREAGDLRRHGAHYDVAVMNIEVRHEVQNLAMPGSDQ